MNRETLERDLKRLLIEELDLREHTETSIDSSAPLFGEGLGLDSLDALQLAVAVEERFNVEIPEDDRAKAIFASVAALAEFILRSGSGRADDGAGVQE
jgi:acyl carrier protein